VVVAVVAVRMMQPAIDQEIHMVAVRHRLMAAVVVLAAAGNGGAPGGVGRIHCQGVLVIVSIVRAVQMAVMQVVYVAVVANACMATVVAVNVAMLFVNVVAHAQYLLQGNR
jgi:hypothetical protein